jgi:hypothetical protein
MYSDSKPMIEGVMMRLFVAVWKLTVATAWQTATTSITMMLSTRMFAMIQKPSDPGGIGLPQARLP